MPDSPKARVLIFIVAYNAERTIAEVLRRLPSTLSEQYDVEVLIIDDASSDFTFERSHEASRGGNLPFPVRVLFNPVNQGYGGNQKLGYHYAIEQGFDFVALLHGDGQYAPECLPDLLAPLVRGDAAAVFGSRMLTQKGALRGGMPLYKFVGNRILTWIENKLLHANLSEFHSGYRIYSVSALQLIPFERNSNGFHFDTEIIIQLLIAHLPIAELPIPTYYGDEICHVNGIKYAVDVVIAALKARLQEMSLFYDRRFDCMPATESPYRSKLAYASPHTFALECVRPHSRVLDLGCAGGYMGAELKQAKQCWVAGVDTFPAAPGALDDFRFHDLNTGPPDIHASDYDFVLMLDVIEHLVGPELFLEQLRTKVAANPDVEVIISTGNIAFFVTRCMLLMGQFNYGKRGILDMTHTRLFTFASLRRALEQAGFDILEVRGVPAPYPMAIGENVASRVLLVINKILMFFSRGLFSYQIFMRVKAQPVVGQLLNKARDESHIRAGAMGATQ